MSVHTVHLPRLSRKHTEFKKQSDLSPNPFVCTNKDIFTFWSKQIQEQNEEKIFYHKLKVCDKTTFASRTRSHSFPIRKILESDSRPNEAEEKPQTSKKYDPDCTISTARCYRFKKESLSDYIQQRREMFLAQFSIDVKQDAIREIKTTVSKEEKKIIHAEQKLEKDALAFEDFLKETDKKSLDALKKADQETKAKLEKNTEIQKATAEIMAIKNDIARCEEIRKEYKLYEDFLKILSPAEWQETHNQKKINRDAAKKREKERRFTIALPLIPTKKTDSRLLSRADVIRGLRPQSRRKSTIPVSRRSSTRSPSVASADEREPLTGDSDSEEESELYFTDPQQLLQIFAELEEQNVVSIQNSQEFDETIQESREGGNIMQERMNQKIKVLKEHKEMLSEALVREEERIAELELKVKMFSFGEFKSEDQDKMLSTLNKKITEVYISCIGEVQATINSLQMLSSIENRLGELHDKLESAPKESVEAAEKAKQKESRMRIREERLKHQLQNQEVRLMHALERATAEPYKTSGRKLMKRSEPPSRRQKKKDVDRLAAKKQEEQQYFFT